MKISESKLKNGLKFIHVNKDSEVSTVLFMVSVGSKYETGKIAGISHFLEHMFFKGTKNRPSSIEIAEYIEGIGGSFNAFTGKEYTGFYAEVEKKHTNQAYDFISDLILRPLFSSQEIEKEKGVIAEEMNMYQDMPMEYVSELFETLLYGDTPAGRLTIGKKEAIMTLQRKDFVDYLKNHYLCSNGVLVYVGSVGKQKAKEMANKYFSKLRDGKAKEKEKVFEKQSAPRVLLHEKKTDQTHLCMGFRTVDIMSKKRYVASVLSAILGGGMSSRLFTEIREKRGLCYYIRASQHSYTDSGYLVFQAGVDNRKVDEAVKAILFEAKKIKEKGVGEKELKKVKEYLKGRLALGLETTQDTAIFFAEQKILRKEIETLEQKYKKIDAVTKKDIMDFVKIYLKEQALNLALIGPFKDKKGFLKILKM